MTDYVEANDLYKNQSSKNINYQTLLTLAQQIFSALISFGALFTASGFIIVNSYLAKFTDVFTYSILPTRYLTAGIGLWIIWGIFIVAISPLIYRYDQRLQNVEKQMDTLKMATRKSRLASHIRNFMILFQFTSELRHYLQVKKRSLLWITIIYLFVGGYIYGTVIYERIPHFLGGGAIPEVSIVVKPDVSISKLGLAADPNHIEQTQPVKLLAELNNGLLVQDLATGLVLALYYEDIAAVIDNHLVKKSPTIIP